GRGGGIVAQDELIARMQALGLDTHDLGVAMSTRKILDQSGQAIATLECPQVLTAWERVYRVLRDAFPAERYHRGQGLKAFEQNAAEVSLILPMGTRSVVTCLSEQTACARPCGSSACQTPRRSMRAMLPGGR